MKKRIKKSTTISYLVFMVALLSCKSDGTSSSPTNNDATSTRYPYMASAPRVTSIPNIYDQTRHDMTVELEATGPDPIFGISLWVHSKSDPSTFAHMELHPIGGNTWSATTNVYLPLPAGDYYIDDVMIEDADPFATGPLKSGWYMVNPLISSTHYTIDQRLTDNDPQSSSFGTLEHNFGVSSIPVFNFSLQ
mgnify:CR=1 FL=1